MKSDGSELIVPKTILITKQQNSAEQIIPVASKQNEVAETDWKLRKSQKATSGGLASAVVIDVNAFDASDATPDNKTASSVGLGIQTGARVIQEDSQADGEGAIQEREAPQQSDRRSLERVESIKNLHLPERRAEVASPEKDQNLNTGAL